MNTDFELRLPFVDVAMSGNWFDTLLDLQRQQWDALQRWQTLWIGLQQDAFDQWVSHWGGGVPIDG
jgi:hypothetical protein